MTLVPPGTPNIGYSDIANIALKHWLCDFPHKQRWLQERWLRLAPFTSGPTAILVKRPGDEAIYKEDMTDGDSWSWKVQ